MANIKTITDSFLCDDCIDKLTELSIFKKTLISNHAVLFPNLKIENVQENISEEIEETTESWDVTYNEQTCGEVEYELVVQSDNSNGTLSKKLNEI